MFLVEKKNGGYRPVLDLSPLNTFIETTHFKMENLATLKSLINPGDYMINIDLTDAYLSVPIHQESQKFLRFIWQNKAYQFKAMPFELNVAPRIFTKLLKPVVAWLRGQGIRLIIYLDDILIMASSVELVKQHKQITIRLLESLGFLINYDKSMLIPTQKIQFLGLLIDSTQMLFIPPETKTTSIRKARQQLVNKQRPTFREEVSRVLGLLEFCRPAVWSAPLHYRQLQELQISLLKRWSDYDQQILLTRPDKADLLWWINNLHLLKGSRILPPTADHDNIRCFQNGLGCFHGNPDDRRQMVAGGSTGTHQYSRTQSGIFCSQVVLERQNKQSDLLKIGQHYGGSVLEQHGGHTLSSASSIDSRDVGMVRKEKRISSRPTYSRSKQYDSRCRVPSYEGLERLEAEVRCDPPINNRMPSRPICITPVPPARQICQLETGPQRIIHGCLCNQLEQHDSVCLSSVQSHPCSPAQSESRECDPGVSSSTLVGPTVVASVDRNVDRLPSVLGKQQGTSDGHVESGSIPPTIPHAQVSRVENIRGQFASTGLSNIAVELLSNSVKASTAKSYNCSWTIWSRWCDKRQSNPILCPINEILISLAEKYSEGKEYRTINVFRSAISSTHIHIDNKPVGQHPLVIRLMKGISISRPPQPRYHTTWDVKKVTEFLSNLGDNSSLSLKQLSQKLCMLMALSCPERSSIMATLDIRYMRRYPEGIKFLHTTYRKRSHNGTLGESIYPKFSQCSRLCPVECLSTYLEKTKQWRLSLDSMQQLLFLALKKPHRPVSSATLSRWLKEVIHLAGIKEDIFKGHSVRGASTSAAKRAGLSIGTILSMADWTNTSTFNKFYYKPSLPVLFGTFNSTVHILD